jgi:scyllo-inositol 2-dehydrogenase (NADP+)
MAQKLVVGVASFGMSGRVFHLPLLMHHKAFHVGGIVERTPREAGKLYPQVKIYRSFDEMLHDRRIELVVVNTPDPTHFELARRALEAEKHVVIEKPFMQTTEQCEEVIRVARKGRKEIFVFQNRRWDCDFRTVQKLIRDGRLGRIVEFEANWNRYRNSIQPQSWKEERLTGAELLYNLGSHLIDQAMVLFGIPEAVTAHLGIVRPGGRVNDWFDLRLHYPSVKVNLRASYIAREPGPRYLVHGELGSFVKYGIDPQEQALVQGGAPTVPDWGEEAEEWWGTLHTESDGAVQRLKLKSERGNYQAFYDNVYDCIVSGARCAVAPEEGMNVISVIVAAIKSSEEKRTVPLN